MTTTPTAALDAERWRIIQRLSQINAEIKDLTLHAEALKGELRTLPAGDYTDPDGRPVVRLSPTRRFDADAALRSVPAEERSRYLKVSIDADALRENMTPAQVEAYMVESGKPKVVLL